jgi:hypothetical protein
MLLLWIGLLVVRVAVREEGNMKEEKGEEKEKEGKEKKKI